jgi:membrane protease YdiL (CAAX protease family)
LRESIQTNRTSATGRPDLTKLAFSLVGIFFGYWLFSRFEGTFLFRQWTHSTGSSWDRYLQLAEIAYPLRAFFILIELLVVTCLFWPVSLIYKNEQRPAGPSRIGRDVGLGVICGLTGFVVMIPFLWGVRGTPYITGIVAQDASQGVSATLGILLFGFLLPIETELVFRAIVQSMLSQQMISSAAIVVSAVLGACLWSFFNFPFSMGLGLVCGSLFRWRGSLISPIVAHIVMTVSAGIYVGLRARFHG